MIASIANLADADVPLPGGDLPEIDTSDESSTTRLELDIGAGLAIETNPCPQPQAAETDELAELADMLADIRASKDPDSELEDHLQQWKE